MRTAIKYLLLLVAAATSLSFPPQPAQKPEKLCVFLAPGAAGRQLLAEAFDRLSLSAPRPAFPDRNPAEPLSFSESGGFLSPEDVAAVGDDIMDIAAQHIDGLDLSGNLLAYYETYLEAWAKMTAFNLLPGSKRIVEASRLVPNSTFWIDTIFEYNEDGVAPLLREACKALSSQPDPVRRAVRRAADLARGRPTREEKLEIEGLIFGILGRLLPGGLDDPARLEARLETIENPDDRGLARLLVLAQKHLQRRRVAFTTIRLFYHKGTQQAMLKQIKPQIHWRLNEALSLLGNPEVRQSLGYDEARIVVDTRRFEEMRPLLAQKEALAQERSPVPLRIESLDDLLVRNRRTRPERLGELKDQYNRLVRLYRLTPLPRLVAGRGRAMLLGLRHEIHSLLFLRDSGFQVRKSGFVVFDREDNYAAELDGLLAPAPGAHNWKIMEARSAWFNMGFDSMLEQRVLRKLRKFRKTRPHIERTIRERFEDPQASVDEVFFVIDLGQRPEWFARLKSLECALCAEFGFKITFVWLRSESGGYRILDGTLAPNPHCPPSGVCGDYLESAA